MTRVNTAQVTCDVRMMSACEHVHQIDGTTDGPSQAEWHLVTNMLAIRQLFGLANSLLSPSNPKIILKKIINLYLTWILSRIFLICLSKISDSNALTELLDRHTL